MSLSTSSYKGTRDLYPEDMRVRNYIFSKWRQVVESFGYEEYDAPMLEPLELYAAKSGQEIVNDQTYRFTDRGEREVAIRPEMTPSVARMVAARRQEIALPARLYSISNFMRYERPQKGREREFWQLNFDLFGVENIKADIEILSLSSAVVKSFNATDDMFTIRISDRQWIDFVMRSYLGLDETRSLAMVKLFDRFEKMDRSSFNEQAADIFGADDATDGINKINSLLVSNIEDLPAEVRGAEFASIRVVIEELAKRGVTNVTFDPTLMRGFDYYTGIVFEIFDEAPENRRAMFGGGRYDGLVGLFGVEDLPVVGAAPGETMFVEFLVAHDLLPNLQPTPQVTVLELGDADSSSVVTELRTNGIRVTVDFTNRKLDRKIKAAVKAGVSYVMFVGNDELTSGNFPLKNLVNGEQNTLDLEQIIVTVSS
ncbi:MAG TPA: histidine--tRNA ligase [Candidatus Nanoperiomorbaceae bacterium]|nr:histidine--tRNA ligase [Candidatus Nanoperiomorbaceae bacterium]